MTDASIERDIGKLQAQVEGLKEKQDDMDHKLDEVLSFMQGAKGSWKALVGIASLASAITALVIKVWAAVSR